MIKSKNLLSDNQPLVPFPQAIRVTAGVLIKNQQFLIAKRPKNKKQGEKWEFPGGKIENGETAEQCLIREWAEELNIHATIHAFLGIGRHNYGSSVVELNAYRISGDTKQLVLREHDAVAWITVAQRHEYDIAEADWFILDLLGKEIGY